MRSGLAAAAFLFAVSGCSSSDAENGDGTSEGALGSTYSASIRTNPGAITAGADVQVDVRIADPSGRQVKQFDLLHTQPMHLIAVSSDLQDFIHVHPALQPAGDLTTDMQFKLGQPYSVFVEYDPMGPDPSQTNRASLAPMGATPVAPVLTDAFKGSVAKSTMAGGTRVELQPVAGHMIMPNMAAHLVFKFTDAATGQAVDNLTSWLGMPAHAIVISADSKIFLHLHGMADTGMGSMGGMHHPGMGDMAGMGDMGGMAHDGEMSGHDDMGPTATGPIGVDVTFPKAGLYKMFFQFQRGTEVVTAPFVVNAMSM